MNLGGELLDLMRRANEVARKRFGSVVSYSKNVFVPLTRLCRNRCRYCTFRREPDEVDSPYLPPEEVFKIVEAGRRAGCKEVLFTFGERPEERYDEALEWLEEHGYSSTIEYLVDLCRRCVEEYGMLPHSNPGVVTKSEMRKLRRWNASLGLMMEILSDRLCEEGGPHEHSPGKRPEERLKVLKYAGQLKVPFTTGILIGIGETWRERVETLEKIRELHERYGHVQEVIVQNFRAKPGIPMEDHPEPTPADLLRTVAKARLMLPDVPIQVPPNLNRETGQLALLAGANDWGGVSPVTKDYVNPEAPWPEIEELKRLTEEVGLRLRERLPIYPEYVRRGWYHANLADVIEELADEEGFAAG